MNGLQGKPCGPFLGIDGYTDESVSFTVKRAVLVTLFQKAQKDRIHAGSTAASLPQMFLK